MRAVELLPFVPTTCTAAKRSCGLPSTVSSRRIRSRPKRMPKSSSERRCSSARAADQVTAASSRQGLQLLAQPDELLALGVHDRGGRALDEPRVAELALRAADLRVELRARR